VSGAVGAIEDELPLSRLEALSDGVFAIAITLLVLELGVDANAHEHLLRSILHEWPSLLAYLTSFLTIGVVWLRHSAITSALGSADVTLYRLNPLVLLVTSFLPFPTMLVSTSSPRCTTGSPRGRCTGCCGGGSTGGAEAFRCLAVVDDPAPRSRRDGAKILERAEEGRRRGSATRAGPGSGRRARTAARTGRRCAPPCSVPRGRGRAGRG
jgi:Endosomal/lysosomal potassium channel TMEM175